MEKRLFLGLLVALVLSAGSLHAQDSSGDDSGPSDTGPSSGPGDTAPSDDSGSADNSGPTDNSDPDPDQTDPPAVTDPTSINSLAAEIAALTTVDFAAQQAYDAINNPWGGVPAPAPARDLEIGTRGNPAPGQPEAPGTPSPGRPAPPEPGPGIPSARRAQIRAVIVSNLSDPSQVLSGNVALTVGIIALGPPTGSLKPGHWDPNVRIIPDPDLLNGSKIPPLVPNVIDVRITHYEVTRTIESQGSVSDHP
jgi:hypothetical protein